MKIRIIGGSGSGKTTLARKLSEKYGVPGYDLDELFWDNSGSYGVRRDAGERDRMLRDILAREEWIIEGVYYAWCGACFEEADRIYLLDVPARVCKRRIVRRFFRRKFGIERGKKETFGSLRALLKWTDRYREVNMPEIRVMLSAYPGKVTEVGADGDVGTEI